MSGSGRPLRIAILAHSTNPRGGVVHALELGDALARLGHDAVVHAPDSGGAGFFRATRCATVGVRASPAGGGTLDLVRTRMRDYLDHFAAPANRRFDVWHAQDGISGNALAGLVEQRLIPGFVRTIHHVDDFADAELAALQRRSIRSAAALLVVSRFWQDWVNRELGRRATVVGNGVDAARYSPRSDASDGALRARLALAEDRPVFLAIGGVEARKNTLGILAAFQELYRTTPAQLVIAGGASLLDHGAYQTRFAAALAASGLPPQSVLRTGPLPDTLMPALYRAATALAFPSLREGFGLVVLEAMASNLPVIAPGIAPFTEYLGPRDVLWCDPHDTGSIARAMRSALDPARRADLVARAARMVAAFTWDRVAAAHLDAYAPLLERTDA
jgi:glycosyltransferase-like protein